MAKTIGLFGGSFNPPHIGHQMVCLYVLSTVDVDELWMLPVCQHPFDKTLASFDDRIEMCRLVTTLFSERIVVSDVEKTLVNQSGRTLDMLLALQQQSNDKFRLIVGSDTLEEVDKWHQWEEIVQRANPIVVSREGYQTKDIVIPDVSSTDIRRKISNNESTNGLLSLDVAQYIKRKGLYQ